MSAFEPGQIYISPTSRQLQTVNVIEEVRMERERQVELGYGPKHDDERGAQHLLWHVKDRLDTMGEPSRQSLIQAAALIVAEVERMDRAEARKEHP